MRVMFEYGSSAVGKRGGESLTARPAASAVDLFRRHKFLVLLLCISGAIAGFSASGLLTPKFTATSEIYIDPGSPTGADKDILAPGQDSNGFINYVESQAVILTSRAVLERVAVDEGLARDADLTGPSASGGDDARVAAAASGLAKRIKVRRTERTYVLELSVVDRNPEKAARFANAVARAYISTLSNLQNDVSRQTETLLLGRLADLRKRVVDAEKRIEDYKADRGMVGTRDAYIDEQQLTDINAQISAAQLKLNEARAQLDQVEQARTGGEAAIAALAARAPSSSLGGLRNQQAQAHQHLADLSGQLGPRHPAVIEGQARVKAADAAVNEELSRFAKSLRMEADRARQIQVRLEAQLDRLKSANLETGQNAVGLRDLEREAEAARKLYDMFVTRSRESGEIVQMEHTRTRVISPAYAPTTRTSPPSAPLMAAGGAAAGLALGLLLAVMAGGGVAPSAPVPPPLQPPSEPPPVAPPEFPPPSDLARSPPRSRPQPVAGAPAAQRRFVATDRYLLPTVLRRQRRDGLSLMGLGLPVLPASAPSREFDAILEAICEEAPRAIGAWTVAVVGDNDDGWRSVLAFNLALRAARRGLVTALVDTSADGRLTGALRRALGRVDGRAFFRTEEMVLLVAPALAGRGFDASTVTACLRDLASPDPVGCDLILCDGPGAGEPAATSLLRIVDEVMVFDCDPGEETRPGSGARLTNGFAKPTIAVQFKAVSSAFAASRQARA
jgi:uncharacterized protein involved in exopolysaccharide biosynthesis